MSVFLAALLMQYVVSIKAGLINHVQGSANVVALESVRAGHSVKTGSDGFVEILLRPGSFLRLGENSEATIDDTDLATVKVTIIRGPALVEAGERISKDRPITITTGNLTTAIIQTGIYRFENGNATVLQGKLVTGDAKLTYAKGWQVFYKDNYRARKAVKFQETSLDAYSQERSGLIAQANLSIASSLSGSPTYNSFEVWLFSPSLHCYTYIPGGDFRSPYGYRFYTVNSRVVRQYSDYSAPSSASNSSSGGSSTQNNSNSGGGAAPAPAPTASTPAGEQSTPATYIDSKNSAVGATAR
jgi:hypothetical protein